MRGCAAALLAIGRSARASPEHLSYDFHPFHIVKLAPDKELCGREGQFLPRFGPWLPLDETFGAQYATYIDLGNRPSLEGCILIC